MKKALDFIRSDSCENKQNSHLRYHKKGLIRIFLLRPFHGYFGVLRVQIQANDIL